MKRGSKDSDQPHSGLSGRCIVRRGGGLSWSCNTEILGRTQRSEVNEFVYTSAKLAGEVEETQRKGEEWEQ
jgi:hypothetical protein